MFRLTWKPRRTMILWRGITKGDAWIQFTYIIKPGPCGGHLENLRLDWGRFTDLAQNYFDLSSSQYWIAWALCCMFFGDGSCSRCFGWIWIISQSWSSRYSSRCPPVPAGEFLSWSNPSAGWGLFFLSSWWWLLCFSETSYPAFRGAWSYRYGNSQVSRCSRSPSSSLESLRLSSWFLLD